MKTLRVSVLGGTIEIISSNKRTRTITFRTDAATYKTILLTKEEFENALDFWTYNDWKAYLKTGHYRIK